MDGWQLGNFIQKLMVVLLEIMTAFRQSMPSCHVWTSSTQLNSAWVECGTYLPTYLPTVGASTYHHSRPDAKFIFSGFFIINVKEKELCHAADCWNECQLSSFCWCCRRSRSSSNYLKSVNVQLRPGWSGKNAADRLRKQPSEALIVFFFFI